MSKLSKGFLGITTALALNAGIATIPTPAHAQPWVIPVVIGSLAVGGLIGAAIVSESHYHDVICADYRYTRDGYRAYDCVVGHYHYGDSYRSYYRNYSQGYASPPRSAYAYQAPVRRNVENRYPYYRSYYAAAPTHQPVGGYARRGELYDVMAYVGRGL